MLEHVPTGSNACSNQDGDTVLLQKYLNILIDGRIASLMDPLQILETLPLLSNRGHGVNDIFDVLYTDGIMDVLDNLPKALLFDATGHRISTQHARQRVQVSVFERKGIGDSHSTPIRRWSLAGCLVQP